MSDENNHTATRDVIVDFHALEVKVKELEQKLEERGENYKIYNTYVDMEKRIEALEKNYGNCFSIGRAEQHRLKITGLLNREISKGKRMNTMKIELSELRNQIQNNSIADLNHYTELKEQLGKDRVRGSLEVGKNREVLREFIEYLPYTVLEKEKILYLLKKLDGKDAGSARQTEVISSESHVWIPKHIWNISKLVPKEDLMYLFRRATQDEDVETLEEYQAKMTELQKYLTEEE